MYKMRKFHGLYWLLYWMFLLKLINSRATVQYSTGNFFSKNLELRIQSTSLALVRTSI